MAPLSHGVKFSFFFAQPDQVNLSAVLSNSGGSAGSYLTKGAGQIFFEGGNSLAFEDLAEKMTAPPSHG
jgi:hypothetical protein